MIEQRISAIDLGSNAIRLMIAKSSEDKKEFTVIKKMRAAVRLGHDVFACGQITKETIHAVLLAFKQFSEENKKFNVQRCKAVATSACREATNRYDLVRAIKEETGISLEIIDGSMEGQLIHQAVCMKLNLQFNKTMLIDVGGGSVEITFSKGNSIQDSKSFPFGTVRMLETLKQRNLNESHINILMSEYMTPLTQHIYKNCELNAPSYAIGTGGNLECLSKLKAQLLKNTQTHFLTLPELEKIIGILRDTKIKDRIEKLKLRKDRADVIIPAATIIHTIMLQGETDKIIIPLVGLRDGLIWSMLN